MKEVISLWEKKTGELTGFAPQFESQGSHLCWENLCLSIRAGTSSLGCGTGLKVPPTVGALPKISRG